MKKAYVYKTKNGDECVVIASSVEAAKKAVDNPDAVFKEEPARAYNNPSKNGIVIATSIDQIRHDSDVNMEYWDAVDSIINKHISACIKELKKWSVTDIVLDEDFEEEDVIFEISKKVGEVLLETLEDWGHAEFPLFDDEPLEDSEPETLSSSDDEGDNSMYIEMFQKECDGWHHEYSTVAITNTSLEAVVKVAKEYAEKHAYHYFEACFNNGKEENGVVTFTAYREHPDGVSDFFSKHLPNSVVYADIGWDYHEVYVKKNGEEYDGFTAKWREEEPEGYKEDGEEDDEDAEVYYDCDVVLTDDETGYEFYTGGGMCSEAEYEEYCKLICTH